MFYGSKLSSKLSTDRESETEDEEEREREEEEEDVGTRRKGAQEKGERSRRGVSVVGEGEWRWGSRMRKPSECGSF